MSASMWTTGRRAEPRQVFDGEDKRQVGQFAFDGPMKPGHDPLDQIGGVSGAFEVDADLLQFVEQPYSGAPDPPRGSPDQGKKAALPGIPFAHGQLQGVEQTAHELFDVAASLGAKDARLRGWSAVDGANAIDRRADEIAAPAISSAERRCPARWR